MKIQPNTTSRKVDMPAPLYVLCAFITAMVGKNMHGSSFWAVVDFFIWPLVWLKWFAYQEVNMTLIFTSFNWFFR
jgi:hypothetical protein